jgi:hypothetical protein
MRRILLFFLAMNIVYGEGLAFEDREETLPVEAVIERFNPPVDVVIQDSPRGIIWASTISHDAPTKYIAIHISKIEPSGHNSWLIHIKRKDGEPIQKIDPGGLRISENGLWTTDVSGDEVKVELEALEPHLTFHLQVDKYLYENQQPAVKSIMDPNNSNIQDIGDFSGIPLYEDNAKAVARMRINDGSKRRPCTGFLISVDHLITNDHCLPPSPHKAELIEAIFGYEENHNNSTAYLCHIVTRSYPLDYAFLKCDGQPGEKWGFLTLSSIIPADASVSTFIIHHPNGNHKKLTLSMCRWGEYPVAGRFSEAGSTQSYSTKQDFQHFCDTEGGSSGAPVFSSDGKVIGIHHFGFDPAKRERINQGVLGSLVKQTIADLLTREMPVLP